MAVRSGYFAVVSSRIAARLVTVPSFGGCGLSYIVTVTNDRGTKCAATPVAKRRDHTPPEDSAAGAHQVRLVAVGDLDHRDPRGVRETVRSLVEEEADPARVLTDERA